MAAKQESCAFTGHRPEKLPWGDNERDPRCVALRKRILQALWTAYDEGYRYFLCGMAQGCDLLFGEEALRLRGVCPEVKVEAAVPYPEQADRWPAPQRERYRILLEACDQKTLVSPRYTPHCLLRRDRYLVDRASLLLAAYDGSPGGTKYTILYTLQQKIEVRYIPVSEETDPDGRNFEGRPRNSGCNLPANAV